MRSNGYCRRRSCFGCATLLDCAHQRSCIREFDHSAGTECGPSRGRSPSAEPKTICRSSCTRTQRPWLLTRSIELSSRLWRRHCWRSCRPDGSCQPRAQESRPASQRTQRCLERTPRTRDGATKGRAWEELLSGVCMWRHNSGKRRNWLAV